MATIKDERPVITNNTITFGNQNASNTPYYGDPRSVQFDPTNQFDTNHWVDYRDNTSYGPKSYQYNTHQHSYEEILRKRILEESHAKKISMVIQEFFDDE